MITIYTKVTNKIMRILLLSGDWTSQYKLNFAYRNSSLNKKFFRYHSIRLFGVTKNQLINF